MPDLGSARGGAFGKLIVFLAVVAAAVTLGWMLLLPSGVAKAVGGRNGFATEVDRLAFNPFSGRFSGGGVRIDNPAQWGGGAFVRLSAFEGKAETFSVTKEELVIEELTVEIAHLVIIVTADGHTNAEAFGAGFAALPTSSGPAERRAVAGLPGLGDGPKSLLVKQLRLKVGKVEVIQPDNAALPRIVEQLDFTGNYQNVRQFQDLWSAELLGRLAQSPGLWRIILSNEAISGGAGGDSTLQRFLNQAGGVLNSLFRTLDH